MTHYYYYTNEKKRDSDFKGTSVILPDPLSPHWPIVGFKHVRPDRGVAGSKTMCNQRTSARGLGDASGPHRVQG
jgi:hypothetical protein